MPEVSAEVTVKSAKLDIQANNGFVVFLNGNLIGKGDEWKKLYSDIPIRPDWFRECGEQVLGVYFYDTEGAWTFLIYRLEINLSDGSKKFLYSDGDERIFDLKTGGLRKKFSDLSIPSGWNSRGMGFDDSPWIGTAQCIIENELARKFMTQLIDFNFSDDYVPAIRPPVINSGCSVDQPGDSYLIREVFEIRSCSDRSPTPVGVCPGWRINAGSEFHYLDAKDKKWERDRTYERGKGFGREASSREVEPLTGRQLGQIEGTDDHNLFHSFALGVEGRLKYVFEVPNAGLYKVTLRFSEPNNGLRSFDIAAEGKTVSRNFSPYRAAGRKMKTAVNQTFFVRVDDGVLEIELGKQVGEPLLNGIEILCAPISEENVGIQAMAAPTPSPTLTAPAEPPTVIPSPRSARVDVGPSQDRIPTVSQPTPSPTARPTPTSRPSPIPAPVIYRQVKTSWKLLDMYFHFAGMTSRGDVVRLHAFREIEFLGMPGRPLRNESPHRVRVTMNHGTQWELEDFVRVDPKTGKEERNFVFILDAGLDKLSFERVKKIVVVGDASAFENNLGMVTMDLYLKEEHAKKLY